MRPMQVLNIFDCGQEVNVSFEYFVIVGWRPMSVLNNFDCGQEAHVSF